MNILLGVTGSVATTVAPKLIELFRNSNADLLKVVITKHATYFWKPDLLNGFPVFKDEDEWPRTPELYAKGDEVLHIELRKWADILVIAPLSANTLAKLANGISDNLLTSIVRAWDFNKPIVVAPAMNTLMWSHPATKEHLEKLQKWYPKFEIVAPISKILACGDEGVGAMASIEDIVSTVNSETKS